MGINILLWEGIRTFYILLWKWEYGYGINREGMESKNSFLHISRYMSNIFSFIKNEKVSALRQKIS